MTGAYRRHVSPATVLIVVAVLLAIVTVWLIARPQPASAPGPADGPSAVLDGALASGTPAYVLIHSLT